MEKRDFDSLCERAKQLTNDEKFLLSKILWGDYETDGSEDEQILFYTGCRFKEKTDEEGNEGNFLEEL
jgi:hypothetical protein